MAGRINITGGAYKDAELPYNKNELNIGGKISAAGEIYDISLITHAGAEYLKFDDEANSIVSSGIKGNMLLWNNMGFQLGANIYVFKMQDDNTEIRFYPNASFDWALTRSSFIKISFKPSVARHSHSDLYDRNGLVLPVPVLFEDKKRDIDGEIGWRFKPGSLISAGIFYIDSDQSLIFSRKGNFFDVVKNESVKMTGFRIKGKYDRDGKWGFDGEFLVRNTSWNVPYLPAVQTDIHGYMTPYKKWLFRGAVHFFGEHYLEIDSDDTDDSFFTIDFGVERELLSFLSVYIDIRNITDSDGTWWTSQYRIPGIGLYAGLKSRF
ncbi:MAG: TonB-dependent receptor [Candidatus Latescibacteria bacterium]|nr:TonB-dependent receptor [Candidatus Latescibacterota bacterium]